MHDYAAKVNEYTSVTSQFWKVSFLEYVYLLGEWQNISVPRELYNTQGEEHTVPL
jgi:hypothetical protein